MLQADDDHDESLDDSRRHVIYFRSQYPVTSCDWRDPKSFVIGPATVERAYTQLHEEADRLCTSSIVQHLT